MERVDGAEAPHQPRLTGEHTWTRHRMNRILGQAWAGFDGTQGTREGVGQGQRRGEAGRPASSAREDGAGAGAASAPVLTSDKECTKCFRDSGQCVQYDVSGCAENRLELVWVVRIFDSDGEVTLRKQSQGLVHTGAKPEVSKDNLSRVVARGVPQVHLGPAEEPQRGQRHKRQTGIGLAAPHSTQKGSAQWQSEVRG